MDTYRLDRQKTALLVVDIQDRLCRAMDPKKLERLINRTVAAITGARTLGLPVLYTEQHPKGLGPTLEPVLSVLEGAPRFEKLTFSSALPEVLEALGGRDQILIAGMETHICVFQTVRDLLERNLKPYVLQDAVISRTEEDRAVGVNLAQELGAVITTVECALFDLLGKAGTPEFKAISQAVK